MHILKTFLYTPIHVQYILDVALVTISACLNTTDDPTCRNNSLCFLYKFKEICTLFASKAHV